MGHPIFVSGIDTGVGKSVATGMMARYLRSHGVDASTLKLVQTGNVGRSEDIEVHRAIMGTGMFEEDRSLATAPQIFAFPASPLFAATREGRAVDMDAMRNAVDAACARHEVVLVEGAGGLAVPLTQDVLTVDFVRACGWPTILVTSGKLGGINHTLLSIEALEARDMPLRGLVYNTDPGADPEIDADTPRFLAPWMAAHHMAAPIVRMPRVADFANPPAVDFAPLFHEEV